MDQGVDFREAKTTRSVASRRTLFAASSPRRWHTRFHDEVDDFIARRVPNISGGPLPRLASHSRAIPCSLFSCFCLSLVRRLPARFESCVWSRRLRTSPSGPSTSSVTTYCLCTPMTAKTTVTGTYRSFGCSSITGHRSARCTRPHAYAVAAARCPSAVVAAAHAACACRVEKMGY